jgi:hypothetical protein
MQNRQNAHPEAATQGDPADRGAAAAAEIDRIARASFPTPVQGAARGTAATPARRPPPAPGRDNDVSR